MNNQPKLVTIKSFVDFLRSNQPRHRPMARDTTNILWVKYYSFEYKYKNTRLTNMHSKIILDKCDNARREIRKK